MKHPEDIKKAYEAIKAISSENVAKGMFPERMLDFFHTARMALAWVLEEKTDKGISAIDDAITAAEEIKEKFS